MCGCTGRALSNGFRRVCSGEPEFCLVRPDRDGGRDFFFLRGEAAVDGVFRPVLKATTCILAVR